jgi:hypothetical protein
VLETVLEGIGTGCQNTHVNAPPIFSHTAPEIFGNNAPLITGHWRLNDLANVNGVSVHGVLWVLDEMVHFKALTPRQAAAGLKQMLDLGARLPLDECSKRLASWSE